MTCIPKYNPKIGDVVEAIIDIENRFYTYTKGHKFIVSKFKEDTIILSDLSHNNYKEIKVWGMSFHAMFKLFAPIVRKESNENLCPRCGEPHGMNCSCSLRPCFMLKEKPKKKVNLEIWVNFYKDYYTVHSSRHVANNCAKENLDGRLECVNFFIEHEMEEV